VSRRLAIAAVIVVAIAAGAAYLMPAGIRSVPQEKPDVIVPTGTPSPSGAAAERFEAEALRDTMREARAAAENVEAERLAPGRWQAGLDVERDAETALQQGELLRARTRFREAREAFQGALVEAGIATVQPFQERAARARRRAEAAEAPGLAVLPWAEATRREKEAEEALKRLEFHRARALFEDAERVYGAAEGEATGKR
jgi:hypothetical protein